MDKKAMYKLSYGLFVVTVKEAEKDNGCITNTVMQVTSTPNRISLAVNKENYTHGMIERTGKFNVSVLSEQASFGLFPSFRIPEPEKTRINLLILNRRSVWRMDCM
ncbi:MAG: flavin reductase family protein [Sellimonas intestinalis]